MSLVDQQAQFAQNVSKLLSYIFAQGYKCTFGECWRPPEQAALYAKEGKGIKDSLHCERMAIDLNLFDKEDKYLGDVASYEKFGVYWESLHPHNRWGGRFKPLVDLDHFEQQLIK